jgi:hypothetical protein
MQLMLLLTLPRIVNWGYEETVKNRIIYSSHELHLYVHHLFSGKTH